MLRRRRTLDAAAAPARKTRRTLSEGQSRPARKTIAARNPRRAPCSPAQHFASPFPPSHALAAKARASLPASRPLAGKGRGETCESCKRQREIAPRTHGGP